jgi:hypothetical protein
MYFVQRVFAIIQMTSGFAFAIFADVMIVK